MRFFKADLKKANFSGANLGTASLEEADLDGYGMGGRWRHLDVCAVALWLLWSWWCDAEATFGDRAHVVLFCSPV